VVGAHRVCRFPCRSRPWCWLLATATVLALGACGGHGAQEAQGSSLAGGTQFVGASFWPPAARQQAPDVSGPNLGGGRLRLAGLHGKVVVVNFWASWCAPCRGEAPALAALSQQCRPLGVRFVGVDERDDRSAAQAFERSFGIGYPSLWDPAGEVVLAFRGSVQPQAIPSTLVIDRQGRIAAEIVGASTYSRLKALLGRVAGGNC
jgi:thiol-disulfide isomerase/thioredoxin